MKAREHRNFNLALGAANGLLRCLMDADADGRRVSFGELLLETAASAVGCAATGGIPDAIDPPNFPAHRDIGHGIVPVGAASVAVYKSAQASDNRVVRRLLEGAALGPVGHLVADSTTPAGINLFVRGL